MRIVVFCEEKYISRLPWFKRFFNSSNIESHFYQMAPHWDLTREKSIKKAISKGNVFLVITDYRRLSSPWLIYLKGYISGSFMDKYRLMFFMYKSTKGLPLWMKKHSIIKNMRTLHHTLKDNIEGWNRLIDREIAEKYIINSGYSLTYTDFFQSVDEGDDFIFSLYLEAGFSPNSVNRSSVPILCYTIRAGYISLVPKLVFWGADVNLTASDIANTPIMEAASKGLTDIVKLLINSGADLNNKSRNGQTALVLAVGNGQIESAKTLIKAGADFTIKDQLGMDAKKYATLYNYTELLDLMDEDEN